MEAQKTVACLDFLEKNLTAPGQPAVDTSQLMIDELVEINRVLTDDLNNTFITPIDREDIYHISGALLALAKYSHTTLEEIMLLNVKPDPFICSMIDKVKAETIQLSMSVQHLLRNPRLSHEHIVSVTRLENEIDKIYREAVKVLFSDKQRLATNLQEVLHVREVYRHISNMSDKADAAAEVLGIAIMKLS